MQLIPFVNSMTVSFLYVRKPFNFICFMYIVLYFRHCIFHGLLFSLLYRKWNKLWRNLRTKKTGKMKKKM